MDRKKFKHGCSKMKIVNFIVALFLLLSGCAVPFETADIHKIGEFEGIIGYTAPLTFTAKENLGLTGYTDLGIGFDMAGAFSEDAVLCFYGTGKQKILSISAGENIHGQVLHYNLLVSGAYGIVFTDLNPAKIPYYHYTLLLGMENDNNGFLFGIGVLHDPRYSWELMHEEFSEETHIQAIIGIEINKFLFQIQTAHKGRDDDGDSDGLISFGFGVKL